MLVREYLDKYNKQKVWVVKHSNCGHYYVNQKICGNLFYSKFIRVTKKFIKEVCENE